jgi:hypothetical protein
MTAAVTATQDSAFPPRILVEATNVLDIASDTFTRTTSNGWGTADEGGDWTASGTASDYSTDGSVGKHLLSSVSVSRNTTLAVDQPDFDLTIDFKFAATPTGASVVPGAVARRTTGATQYIAQVLIGTDNTVQIQLLKDIDGTFTTLDGPDLVSITHSVNKRYRLQFVGVGTSLSAKVWDADGTEPDSFQVTATDSDITDAGGVGCRSFVSTGNTNSSPTVQYDNVTLKYPTPATVTLYRVEGEQRTAVRAADGLSWSDPNLVRNDGEYPFKVSLTYVLNVDGSDMATSSAITPTLTGGNVVLSDAITGLSVETKITAWPGRTSDRGSTQFNVGGRTVSVSPMRGGSTTPAEVLTESDTTRDQLTTLLDGATSGIILLRVPDEVTYPGFTGHYFVASDEEALLVQRGSDARRLWTLGLIESDPWAPSLAASGWTLDDVKDAYDGLTLADLADDFDTLLDIAVHDWGAP